MTLPTHEFIRRFLIHVLPKGLHRIRHYGLFANGKNRAANIARARQLFAVQSAAQHNIDPAAESDQPWSSAKAVPMLRWPHDHHRDLSARLSAQVHSGIDQNRLVMISPPLIDDRTRTNRSRRRSTGNARARVRPPILSALTPKTSRRNAPPARQSPYSPAERSYQPLQSKLIKPAAATKSP